MSYNNYNDGIVLIDKNEGETSFDVVKGVRRLLKKKKVGHAGTLDPFATGLLIILLGQGTKLSPYLMSGRKRYLATIRLGIETDTLDKTGRIVNIMPVPDLDPGKIRDVILEFVGNIEQIPPAYSALNYMGKRAYQLARQGLTVELKKRNVTVHSIDIVSVSMPEITIEVSCSSGTYIRSLGADIGKKLGSTAHLNALRRLSSGSFEVHNALDSKIIGNSLEYDTLTEKIISLKNALPDIKECSIESETARKIINGCRPEWDEILSCDPSFDGYKGFIKLVHAESLVAIMEVNRLLPDDKGWLENIRIFT